MSIIAFICIACICIALIYNDSASFNNISLHIPKVYTVLYVQTTNTIEENDRYSVHRCQILTNQLHTKSYSLVPQ